MGKLFAIAHNTFVQTVRQPIYCVLILAMFLVLVLSLPAAGWTMGEGGGDYHDTDQKMLEIMGLSTLLFAGGLLAAFSASSALAKEIEDKTALTVISKPVPRPLFVLGKFAGVSAAVALAYYLGALAFLMTVRHQVVSAASEPFDVPVLVLGFGALGLALAIALWGNFFFSWPFTSAFVWSATVCLTVAMGVILFVGKDWRLVPPGYDEPPKQYDNIRVRLKPGQSVELFRAYAKEQKYMVLRSDNRLQVVYLHAPESVPVDAGLAAVRDWPGVAETERQIDPPVIRPALLAAIGLTFLSLLVLVAVAVAASTRLGLVLTLLVCLGVFLVGSAHPFLFLEGPHNVAIRLLGWTVPNLTFFYSMDVLSRPFETGIPPRFIGAVALYCLLYVGGVLALGIALFQRRQMAAEAASASVPGAVNLLSGLGRAGALVLGVSALILLAVQDMHTAMGMLSIAGAAGLAVLTWLLWGYFGRGAQWSYWVVFALACLGLAAGGTLWAGRRLWPGAPEWQQTSLSPASAVLMTVLDAGLLLILLLPKTRRHFHSRTKAQ